MQSIQISAFTGPMRSELQLHACTLSNCTLMLKKQIQNDDHSVTYCWNATVWVDLDKPVSPKGFVVIPCVKYAAYQMHIA